MINSIIQSLKLETMEVFWGFHPSLLTCTTHWSPACGDSTFQRNITSICSFLHLWPWSPSYPIMKSDYFLPHLSEFSLTETLTKESSHIFLNILSPTFTFSASFFLLLFLHSPTPDGSCLPKSSCLHLHAISHSDLLMQWTPPYSLTVEI